MGGFVSRHIKTLGLAVLALAIAAAAPAQAQRSNIVYYGQGNGADAETSFPYQVLKLALSKCGKDYVLKPSPIGKANEKRATEAMAANGPIDVQWVGASLNADAKMSPVLIPIDEGLLGYRLFLIDGTRQDDFAQIKTLDDLKKMVALQGKGWADVDVLRSAGLPVRTGPEYKNLFRMLIGGRADYFPRGAWEAYNERVKFASEAPGLTVEDTLILHYVFSVFLYTRKADKILHDDIYRGLVAAHDDGSFQKLFLSNPDVQTVIKYAHMGTRHIINIDNPYISNDMKAIDQKYWYKP